MIEDDGEPDEVDDSEGDNVAVVEGVGELVNVDAWVNVVVTDDEADSD